jgi:prepilin-type N-terminal cleavage/methylation domain-containing protein
MAAGLERKQTMTKRGFTLIEMIIVLALIGLIGALVFPRLRDAFEKTNVRSARVAAGTLAAKARAAAVARGCRSALHFDGKVDNGVVWVTVCRVDTLPGIDTLGGVEHLASRFNVALRASRDSVNYAPSGLSFDNVTTIVRFSSPTGASDSVLINPVGKVVR